MATKKQSQKSPKTLIKTLKITYNIFLVVTILALTGMVISQQAVINSFGEQQFKSFVANSATQFYTPLSIDAPAGKAYLPQLDVRFDYSDLASSTQYRMLAGENLETDKNNAAAVFTPQINLASLQYSTKSICEQPYTIVIGQDLIEDYDNVGSKVLADGREVVFGVSTTQACNGYVTGLTGTDFLKFLNTIQSY
ncbi:MAG: hypothetical protein WAQ27_01650 [Candidatus Microsaccharimonas sp.]